MNVPEWISHILSTFDGRSAPHSETEIAKALEQARSLRGDLQEDEWKVYLAEYSVFFLVRDHRRSGSAWGTYFGPMIEFTREDGSSAANPDILQLDAESVTHWEMRSNEAHNPIMRARYADAAWDLAKAIPNAESNYKMAAIASDSYMLAVEQRLFSFPPFAVQWLVRALELAKRIKDEARTNAAIEAMFAFYKSNFSPKLVGVWIALFDQLYSHPKLVSVDRFNSMISDLETMLCRLSTNDERNEFNPFNAQSVGERLAQHYKRLGDAASVARVVKTFGAAFEKQAEGASAMLATGWLQPIAERYEQEGMKSDAETLRNKLELLYREATGELKTYSIPVQFTQGDVDALFQNLFLEDNLSHTLQNIAAYFTPKVEEAQRLIESKRSVAPLMSMIPVEIIDSRGRPAAHIGSSEDDPEGHLHFQLNHLMTFSDPILYLAMERFRAHFAPSVDDLIELIYECPIFLDSRKALLKQGLLAFLERDFLKAIHILVPQIEEALRNLLVMVGIPPVKNVARHPGITDVKSMNNVLEEERIREVLPENVWRYLTLLYIDRRGVNLRNDLAHGLIPIDGFNAYSANRVVHSLLVLTPIRDKRRGNPFNAPK